MTIHEFEKMISESSSVTWLNSQEFNVTYPYVNFQMNFQGLGSVYQFIVQQIAGWNKFSQTIPSELASTKTHLENLRSEIVAFVQNYQHEISHLNSYIEPIKRKLDVNSLFTYNAPETEFLVRIHNNYPSAYPGAFSFITGSINMNGGKDNLIGLLLAYEFTIKDDTHIAERKNAERSSINKIRSDFFSYLKDSEATLITHLESSNRKLSEYSTAIDILKEEKEQVFVNLFDQSSAEFQSLVDGSNKSIEELKATYTQLLSLKAPADYWKIRAEKLSKEGWKAVYWLVGLVAFACITLYFLLWLTPEGMLLSFINGQASAIKWSIIYITFISFLAFGIRALNKIAFSSFHLSRDAEEREQLTYVYLAMIKDASVDEKDRHLIMQSLFSRADTGLLKDDSSPTMPGISDKLFPK
jgi:hypothetical protein